MLTNRRVYVLSLVSVILGGILAFSFTSHYLGLFQAVNLEKIGLLIIWGALFSIISYQINKFTRHLYGEKFILSPIAVFIPCLLVCVFIWGKWKPPLLPLSLQASLTEALLPGSNFTDIFKAGIPFIWKMMLGGAFISDVLSLSWMLGIFGLAGMAIIRKYFLTRNLPLKFWLKISLPYIILMTGMIIGNLALFSDIEEQNYYHLRALDGNTLDELVRKSSDTTPLLRVYTTFYAYYPGAQLTVAAGLLNETGLIIEDLWSLASVRKVQEENMPRSFSATDLNELKTLSATVIDAVNKKFYFLPSEVQPVEEVFLIENNGDIFFIPVDLILE